MKESQNLILFFLIKAIIFLSFTHSAFSQDRVNMMDTNLYKYEVSIVSYFGHHQNFCGGAMINYSTIGLGYSTSGNKDYCIDAFGYSYLTPSNRNLRIFVNLGYFGSPDNPGLSYGAGLHNNFATHFKVGVGWHSAWGWMAHIGYVF
jgi:hypothetical protein